MVKIRLKRFGTTKRPCYRIVVQDSRKPRDGTCIEELGIYQPRTAEDQQIAFNEERINYWIGVGAQPTAIVSKLINRKKLEK